MGRGKKKRIIVQTTTKRVIRKREDDNAVKEDDLNPKKIDDININKEEEKFRRENVINTPNGSQLSWEKREDLSYNIGCKWNVKDFLFDTQEIISEELSACENSFLKFKFHLYVFKRKFKSNNYDFNLYVEMITKNCSYDFKESCIITKLSNCEFHVLPNNPILVLTDANVKLKSNKLFKDSETTNIIILSIINVKFNNVNYSSLSAPTLTKSLLSQSIDKVKSMIKTNMNKNGNVNKGFNSSTEESDGEEFNIKDKFLFQTDFDKFYNCESLSDVTFIINGKDKFYSHKFILAARSPIFYLKFTKNLRIKELSIDNVDKHIFELFLRYIYTERVLNTLNIDDTKKLISLSDKYKIERLKNLCEEFLIRLIDRSNCIDYLIFSHNNQANYLKERSMDVIILNFNTFKAQEFELLNNNNPKLFIEVLHKNVLNIIMSC